MNNEQKQIEMKEIETESTVTVRRASDVLTDEQLTQVYKEIHQCHNNAAFNALQFGCEYVEGYIDGWQPHACNRIGDTYFCATLDRDFKFMPVRTFQASEIMDIFRAVGGSFLTIGNTPRHNSVN